MISAITLCALRNKMFFDYINVMDPKPDIWIMFMDDNRKARIDWDVNRLNRISNNYNKIKRLIPDDSTYTLIMEDDCIPIKNGLQHHLENINKYPNIDAVTFPFYVRHPVTEKLNKSTRFADLMVGNFTYDREDKRIYVIQPKERFGFKKIDTTSFNFVLIKSEIVKQISFIPFNIHKNLYIDNLFFLYFKKLKRVLYCDFDVCGIHNTTFFWPGKYYNELQPFSKFEESRVRRCTNEPYTIKNNNCMWIYTVWIGG